MFCLIEALSFRCLRDVRRPLDGLNVLVGPNASGKTTFLDVVAFLRDLVSAGLDGAVDRRTRNFDDLCWRGQGGGFELAVEAPIPERRRALLLEPGLDVFRYEVQIGTDRESGAIGILAETGILKGRNGDEDKPAPRQLAFPGHVAARESLISPARSNPGRKTVFTKRPGQNDNYYSETEKGWVPSFRLGPRRSALANLPEDESRWPVATWFKGMLDAGVQQIVLNSQRMRLASPPGRGVSFAPDGTNLPWAIHALQVSAPQRMADWVEHLRTALPDLRSIRTVENPDDKHRYIVLEYDGGMSVPSWMVSDGTLRLLALTLPAYLADFTGTYLIEEPENGIHPRAVETMFQSLASVYEAQVLLATHSPVVLSVADPRSVFCFAKTEEGATDIVRGDEHPALAEWKGEENLGVLFAGGVLG